MEKQEKTKYKLAAAMKECMKTTHHIVFAPQYRRKIIYGELKQDIANI